MMAAVKGEYRGLGTHGRRGTPREAESDRGCLPFLCFFGIFIILPMLLRRRRGVSLPRRRGMVDRRRDSEAAGGAAAGSRAAGSAGEGASPGAEAPSAGAEPPEAGEASMTNYFSQFDSDRIVAAIAEAEKKSSGEIRVHVTRRIPENLEERALRRFELLGMTKTADAQRRAHLHRAARPQVPDPGRRRHPREVRPGVLAGSRPRHGGVLPEGRVHRGRGPVRREGRRGARPALPATAPTTGTSSRTRSTRSRKPNTPK